MSADSPIELASDDDWKSRVKAEDAKRDAAGQSQRQNPEGEEPRDLPPASFAGLAQLLASQAVAALGMIPGPDGQARTELPIARHFIDLLAVLDEKTRGNLTSQEATALEQTLHDLRMAYVALSKGK